MPNDNLTLIWGDGYVSLQPLLSSFPTDRLLKQLSYWRRTTEMQGWKRMYVNKHEELYVLQDYDDPDIPGVVRKRLVTMSGFMSRIKKFLDAEKQAYTITDIRTAPPVPDIGAAMTGLYDQQKPIVYGMLMSGGGILSAATGVGKTRMTGAIISAYDPDKLKLRGTPLTIFAAPERDINVKNYEELKTVLPDRHVGIIQSGHKQIVTDDVMCVTLDSLDNIDPSQVGLFICDEVHTGVSDSRSAKIQDMKTAVKYGVSATPSGRYDNKDLVVEALFGPVVAKKTYQDAVADGLLVPVNVIWITAPPPELGMNYYEGLKQREAKIRWGITKNREHAGIVSSLLKDIPEDMQTLAIMPTIEQMDLVLSKTAADGLQVAYAHAETREDHLADRGFTSVHAVSPAQRKKLYGNLVSQKVKRALATYIYKQGVNFPGLRVMINAGGGGSEIASKQIPGRVSRTSDGKECGWLIDFWHDWDLTPDKYGKKIPGPLLHDDKKRRKFYSELGFEQYTAATAAEAVAIMNGHLTQEELGLSQ